MKTYHSFLTRQTLLATLLEFLCFGTLAASAGSTYTVQSDHFSAFLSPNKTEDIGMFIPREE
jgi:hypothetical protein